MYELRLFTSKTCTNFVTMDKFFTRFIAKWNIQTDNRHALNCWIAEILIIKPPGKQKLSNEKDYKNWWSYLKVTAAQSLCVHNFLEKSAETTKIHHRD